MRTDAMALLVRFGNRRGGPLTAEDKEIFANWHQRASVRVKPQHILSSQDGLFFPPELVPVVAHPSVVALGEAAMRRLLVHRLYQWLHFTVELEAVTVLPVAARIGRGRCGVTLPPRMLADAFKIVTDEAWHGQFSYELLAQVMVDTKVPPCLPDTPRFIRRLERLRRHIDPDLSGVEDLLFATVSETLISSILSDLPRDRRLPEAVREAAADHAQDEGRHHAYFAQLLRHVWPALSRDQRRRFGPLLPELICAFLEPDYRSMRWALSDCGVPDAELDRVVEESYPDGAVRAAVAQAARSTVSYFADVGALDEPRTRDAFAAQGLVAP
jgi:P-aminobenzoate N-oxygenase AurF